MKNETNYCPITLFAPGVLAGAEKVVITGIHALLKKGIYPHLIVIKEARCPELALNFIKEFSSNVKISIVESHKAFDFSVLKDIQAILNSEPKKKILHTHGIKALVTSQFIKGIDARIHTHHGNTSHTLKMKCYEWMANMAMRRCDQVIAVSHEMKEKLLRELFPYKKIYVICNMLSFNNAAALRIKRANKYSHDKIQLIYIGRLSPEKGLIPFLNNYIAYENKEKFSLTILGDGAEKEKAIAIIQGHNLSASVSFHGLVNNPSDYLVLADALILPSLTEGLPMTLLEALCLGIPVLANNVGAIKSLIKPQINGMLLENNEYSNWKIAFDQTLLNIRSWQKNAMEDAPTVEEKYSAHQWAEETIKIYDLIIS